MFGFGKPKTPPKTEAEKLQDKINAAKEAEASGKLYKAYDYYQAAYEMLRGAETKHVVPIILAQRKIRSKQLGLGD